MGYTIRAQNGDCLMAKFLSMEILQGMDLANRFRLMGNRATNEAQKFVLKAGQLVGGRGRMLVHKLTHRCEHSIATQLQGGSLFTKPCSLTGPQVSYAAALEAMYPYMKPALEQERENIKKLGGNMLITIIRGK